MGLPSLNNCPRCGAVFVKGAHDICANCIKEVDKEYETCAEYIREYKTVSIYELSDATGVSVKQITRFIREGRISIKDNPNLGIPCESCGTPIKSGHYCNDCTERLKKEVGNILGGNDDDKQPSSIDRERHFYQVKDLYKKD